MCQWFSFVTDGKGKMFYFNNESRRVIYDKGTLPCGNNPIKARGELDSHSTIAAFFGLDCDKVNKYEFRPLDRHFTIDQINTKDDSASVKRKCKKLDFSLLAPPELIIKPIIHPFKIDRKIATKQDVELLKKWASVRASVGASVGDSVGASVGDSVWDSVRDSVRASVKASVRASVWDSVWASVGDSVWASVWDSVRASVGA